MRERVNYHFLALFYLSPPQLVEKGGGEASPQLAEERGGRKVHSPRTNIFLMFNICLLNRHKIKTILCTKMSTSHCGFHKW